MNYVFAVKKLFFWVEWPGPLVDKTLPKNWHPGSHNIVQDEILATLKNRTQAESETFDESVKSPLWLQKLSCAWSMVFFLGSEVELGGPQMDSSSDWQSLDYCKTCIHNSRILDLASDEILGALTGSNAVIVKISKPTISSSYIHRTITFEFAISLQRPELERSGFCFSIWWKCQISSLINCTKTIMCLQ